MTLPNREWMDFHVKTIERNSDDNAEDTAGKWTTRHIDTSKIGDLTAGFFPNARYWSWKTIMFPKTGFERPVSMDDVVDFGVTLNATIEQTDCAPVNFDIWWEALDCMNPAPYSPPYQWNPDLVSGRFYDGVNQWRRFPYYNQCWNGDDFDFLAADYPISATRWMGSRTFGGYIGNLSQHNLFQVGLVFFLDLAGCGGACASPLGDNQELSGFVEPLHLVVNYLNPVVNSISARWMHPDGGIRLIFRGLGFDQDDLELSSTTRSTANQPQAWQSIVNRIDFIGQQGQGTTMLRSVLGEFTVNSDTRITINTMPALAVGTYEILLVKTNCTVGHDIEAYAGDWRSDSAGRCTASSRFALLVAESTPKEEVPIILTKWKFKHGDTEIWKHYAPIDIQSTDTFYSGRIVSVSPMTKALDNNIGIPSISDMSITLANNDKEFSKLLAEYMCDDQVVEIFNAWRMSPESWKTRQIRMIVDDWSLKGVNWEVLLKDITQKYFQFKVPRHMITEDEYPNAYEQAIGKPMSEAIGKCYLAGDTPGALEAFLVDTTIDRYLALRGSANAVTEVYSDGVLQATPANYSIVYADGGRTYIDFTADQGDNKVTFNCTGYMLAAWNSANGYVQNPAYVIAFLIALLAEVPLDFIDMTSIDVLAALFVDSGWDECGYLILQEFQNMETPLSEFLFTYGIKANIDKDGRLRFERKDRTNYATDILIFDQIDCMDAPAKHRNRRQAINRVQSQFNYYPTANLYLGSKEDQRDAAIADFGVEIFPSDNPWKFPWTDLENVVVTRLGEELARRSYGDKKCSLSIPMDWIDDIDVLANFMLQDLFGLNPTGAGEALHYYYPESVTLDWQTSKIDIIAIDLQWLVSQCLIIGKFAELNRNYNTASEWQKIFAYIGRCLQGTFANGDPNKKICDCF